MFNICHYGMVFNDAMSVWYSMQCYIGQHYNGIQLYFMRSKSDLSICAIVMLYAKLGYYTIVYH